MPCEILLVGEAPGSSENMLGKPFCGPAGKLLDHIMLQAWGEHYRDYALTNLVACIPLLKDESGRKSKLSDPPKEAIEACAPRLDEFLEIARPDAIVAVGKLSKKHLGSRAVAGIVHPAAILRADVSQRGLAIQQSIVILRDVQEGLAPF